MIFGIRESRSSSKEPSSESLAKLEKLLPDLAEKLGTRENSDETQGGPVNLTEDQRIIKITEYFTLEKKLIMKLENIVEDINNILADDRFKKYLLEAKLEEERDSENETVGHCVRFYLNNKSFFNFQFFQRLGYASIDKISELDDLSLDNELENLRILLDRVSQVSAKDYIESLIIFIESDQLES